MERLSYAAFHRFFESRLNKFLVVGLLAYAFGLPWRIVAEAQTSVTTYHGDAQRTGWNSSEDILKPSNVTATTFGLVTSVTLDDQVDAQPLVVANQIIEGQGMHTVVYVATESNTVYAIDSSTGSILKTANLGAPVPRPPACYLAGPNIGINSTPTIDVEKQTIYVMAYTLVAGQPSYRLHALNLQSLQDEAGSPINVTASHRLTDGSRLSFNSKVERQRPALLESNGNIYAGFGSFCDLSAGSSRGWLLGWNAGTLTALGTNELTDILKTAPANNGTNFFLSPIWMAGYGIADDGVGNVFFVTGNSDPNRNTYTGTTNIQESVVKMPEALTSVLDLFTPSNVFFLDQIDEDYGAGGVLVLPDQPGPVPHLAVAAGKDGRLFILDRDDMGRFHNPDIPAHVNIGGCWCGPSYYQGADGVRRVVSSGGNMVETWRVNTFLRPPTLILEASSAVLAATPQDPGFFTAVSSNGLNANTAIIWAIGRPTGSDRHIVLYAFNGTKSGSNLPLLWSGSAGFWPHGGDANLVPTVANGMVYVASNKELAIFGLTSAAANMEMTFP